MPSRQSFTEVVLKLLSNLASKRSPRGKLTQMGSFLCPYCKKTVVRPLPDGKRNRSCGCNRTPGTHGLTRGATLGGKRDALFWVWNGIKARCYNANHSSYARYGGRGITVCAEWLQDPQLFFAWARENGWVKGLEVDRRENDGPYSPSNCQIVKHVKNCRNRSSSKLTQEMVDEMRQLFAAGGYTKKALGELYGVTDATAGKIVNYKIWVPEVSDVENSSHG